MNHHNACACRSCGNPVSYNGPQYGVTTEELAVRDAAIARLEAAGRFGPTAYFLSDGTPSGGVDAQGNFFPDETR